VRLRWPWLVDDAAASGANQVAKSDILGSGEGAKALATIARSRAQRQLLRPHPSPQGRTCALAGGVFRERTFLLERFRMLVELEDGQFALNAPPR
jgi:hypothetical protein